MEDKPLVRRVYKLFAALLVIWGVWSIAWAFAAVDMSGAIVAAGWLVLVLVGALLSFGLLTTKIDAFTRDEASERKFAESWLSGAPLYLYVLMLLGWVAVFVAWAVTRGRAIDSDIMVYGWALIVVVGLLLLIGLLMNHRRYVSEAMSSSNR